MKRRCLKRALLDLGGIGLGLEPFIDFELTGKSIFHTLGKRSELGYVGNHEGIDLGPVRHDLLVEQKIRRLNKSSIIVHIKRGSHEAIIYYILFWGFFPFIFGIVESGLGFGNAKCAGRF